MTDLLPQALPVNQPVCIILIGLPGSWKTTFRDEIAPLLAERGSHELISSDDQIEALATQLGCTYSEAFARADMKMIDKDLKGRIGVAIAEQRDLVIDRTNMSQKTRNKVLARLTRNYYRLGVDFRVPLATLLERLATRAAATGKHISMETLQFMSSQYQPPAETEFNEIIIR